MTRSLYKDLSLTMEIITRGRASLITAIIPPVLCNDRLFINHLAMYYCQDNFKLPFSTPAVLRSLYNLYPVVDGLA